MRQSEAAPRRNHGGHSQVSVRLIQGRHFAKEVVLLTPPNPRFPFKNADSAVDGKILSIFPLTG
jgi:hypothetical protein